MSDGSFIYGIPFEAREITGWCGLATYRHGKPDCVAGYWVGVGMKLHLPIPPSTNNLFIQRGRHRVKGPKYRAWQEQAQLELLPQNTKPIAGPVAIDIAIPENNRRDIDNYAKPLLDLLVKAGLIENDNGRILRALYLRWHKEDLVEVTIEPAITKGV